MSSIPSAVPERFRTVARMIADAHARSDERAKATHERFNVFTTLLGEHDEVRLHTRFLHCLLDPQGFHDCGSLFLDLFFETLTELQCLDHKGNPVAFEMPQSKDKWKAWRECRCPPHGQIDLLIERPGFGVAVENKIYAAEQRRQLACYAEYLRNKYGDAAHLIYLTLNGRPSETDEGAPYIRISYTKHILAWLENCLRETYRMIPINQALLQYRQVVRSLTGKTLESENMKPIAEFVYKNPDIIRFRKQIETACDEAIKMAWGCLAKEISKKLPDGFKVGLARENLFGPEAALKITPPDHNVLSGAPFEIWAERDPYSFGIGLVPNSQQTDETFFTNMLEAMSREHQPGFHMADPLPRFPSGWHDLFESVDDADLVRLVETGTVNETGQGDLSSICEDIWKYVEVVIKVYPETRDRIDFSAET